MLLEKVVSKEQEALIDKLTTSAVNELKRHASANNMSAADIKLAVATQIVRSVVDADTNTSLTADELEHLSNEVVQRLKQFGKQYGLFEVLDNMIESSGKDASSLHPDAAKVLKHIKPEHHSVYEPYLKNGTYSGSYKDRADVLGAAEKAGHTISEKAKIAEAGSASKINESLKTHYQNGYDAQKKGKTRQNNPHREGSPAASMWAKGWEHSSDNKEPQKFTSSEETELNEASSIPVDHAIRSVAKVLGTKSAVKFTTHLKPGSETHTSWSNINRALQKQGVKPHHIADIATHVRPAEYQPMSEAVKIGSKVVIHAPGKDYHGKTGHVGEIRPGAHNKAPKTYTVDYDYNNETGYTKSVQLDKKHIKLQEEIESVAEAGPFSYGKAPRKGSVADLAAKKRKEQEKSTQPIEPRDQMFGNAKLIKQEQDVELDENAYMWDIEGGSGKGKKFGARSTTVDDHLSAMKYHSSECQKAMREKRDADARHHGMKYHKHKDQIDALCGVGEYYKEGSELKESGLFKYSKSKSPRKSRVAIPTKGVELDESSHIRKWHRASVTQENSKGVVIPPTSSTR